MFVVKSIVTFSCSLLQVMLGTIVSGVFHDMFLLESFCYFHISVSLLDLASTCCCIVFLLLKLGSSAIVHLFMVITQMLLL